MYKGVYLQALEVSRLSSQVILPIISWRMTGGTSKLPSSPSLSRQMVYEKRIDNPEDLVGKLMMSLVTF